MSPRRAGLVGSPRMQWSKRSPRACAHCSSLTVPLTAGPSSSPVTRKPIEPAKRRRRREEGERRRHHRGDAALHVDGAAPVEHAVRDHRRRRVVAPAPPVAGRHDVGMAGEQETGAAVADAGIEVVDVGRARLAEGHAGRTAKPASPEHAAPRRPVRRPHAASPRDSGSAPARGRGDCGRERPPSAHRRPVVRKWRARAGVAGT